jgi:phosphatidylethanolamine-binding protein (PEBP) family uncharacterized protein
MELRAGVLWRAARPFATAGREGNPRRLDRVRRGSPALIAATFAATAVLGAVGCGESTKTAGDASAGAASGSSAAVTDSRAGKGAGGEAVAVVKGAPISKGSLAHWTAVTAALSGAKQQGGVVPASIRDQALGFLISSHWVLGEAARMGMTVSAAEAHGRLAQNEAKQFPKPGELQKFLASSGGETTANLLERSKLELLEAAVARRVTAGKSGAEATAALDRFRGAFETRWRAETTCRPAYVMEDCREYRGPRQPPASASTHSTSAASSSSSSASSSSGGAASSGGASGEVYSAPGSMSIGSSAFERNGAVPASYICAGPNGPPPPLQWQHLPAHTAEMVLFVIDDSSSGTSGGIRWVVAGLTPSTTAIQNGKLPAGAVVGQNSAGSATYGGICPAKGQSDRVQFVLWALSKSIPLSSGFTPAVAEASYSKSELASAVTYAVASRP